MATPKRLLLEHLYDGDLAAEVARRTAAGQSWREVAAHVSEATGHPISYETLRVWYGTTETVAS